MSIHSRKYNLNQSYFENVDSFEKAYWLGFLLADGNVNKFALRIELSNKDVDHLYKIKAAINSEHLIVTTRKNCNRVSFNSMQLVNDLSKYNLIPNKTYTVLTPKIQTNLLSHLYRGIFDGDGWITNRWVKNRIPSYEVCFSSASENFLIEIKEFLNKECNSKKGYIIHRQRINCAVYELHFGGNTQFYEICDVLYKNSTHETRLTRKYNKYLSTLDLCKNPQILQNFR